MIARATLATNLITQPSEGSQQQVPLCEHSEVHNAVSKVDKGIRSGWAKIQLGGPARNLAPHATAFGEALCLRVLSHPGADGFAELRLPDPRKQPRRQHFRIKRALTVLG